MDKQPKWMTITGWVLTVLIGLMLTASAAGKLAKAEAVMEGLGKSGFDEDLLLPIGIIELVCVAFYLFPRTAPLGAILIAGYLGGATVTHLRIDEPVVMPIVIGVIAWLGLFFRERRVRAILPWMPAEPKL